MEMKDLIPPDKWLEFGTDVFDRSGMNAYAYDVEGGHLIEQRKWANQLCPVLRGNPDRAKGLCDACHQTMSATAQGEGKIVIGTCGAGLLNISVPVFVGEEFVGIVGCCGLLPPEGTVDGELVKQVTGMEDYLAVKLGQGIRQVAREDIEADARYLEGRVQEMVQRHLEGVRPAHIKTFRSLIKEVQRKGLCHQCGGCVTFCTAMNYGALELSETGRPRFRDPYKCIECGVCYMICPALNEMEDMVRAKVGWKEPMGAVLDVAVVRARDEAIRELATDGGAVTAILTHLFERGEIDGAAVTRQAGPFRREPWLATNADEVMLSAGSNFDYSRSGSLTLYSQDYSTYSPSLRTLGPLVDKGLGSVALVGTPCQIKAMRKMETLGVVPSQSVHCTLGLFCSGSYVFGDKRREKIERIGHFKWSEVVKINIKDALIIRLADGEQVTVPLEELDFVKRKACRHCTDYAAEFADLAFGGIGAEDGWTTVVARTEMGMRILAEARQTVLEEHASMAAPDFVRRIRENVELHAQRKKDQAQRTAERLAQS
ncbi:Coenzyme F420 hydrogenase/dehydrogenase, beta subunit C-terminal domain [Desulfocurvus sp. DL9XJH121]